MKPLRMIMALSVAAAIASLPLLAQAGSSDSSFANPAFSNRAFFHSSHPDPALVGLGAAEAPRVVQAIDNNVIAPLGSTHVALLDHATPAGRVDDAMPMNHMQLILRPSAARSAALAALISAQHDPASPKFHQWLTPEQFGASFGVADADIAAVTSWLIAQGFTVHGVYPNKLQIDFSGTAGLVQRAFHTQEKRFVVDNIAHVANTGDISVPAALRDVVTGVAGLNDFRPQPLHTAPRWGQYDRGTHRFTIARSAAEAKKPIAPMIPINSSVRGFVPYDMQTMYNARSLYDSGLTGTGITIAVVEDRGMVPGDWDNFVSQFNLGGYGGTFTQFPPQLTPSTGNCTDPGGYDEYSESLETVVDAQYATAMAPGANIWVAACSGANASNFFGGVFTAASNLINNTDPSGRPNIISVSYGYGERYTDTSSKTAIDLMWAQADAEGISVFVATGDSGSNPSFNGYIINGMGVDANSLATSPNDTAVGGTDTADVLDGTTDTYFSSAPNADYGTAKSYVPEITWNASCGNTAAAARLGNVSALDFCKNALLSDPDGYSATSESGSGGPSFVDSKPAWQSSVHGAAKDRSRDVPDVSLFAGSYGNHSWVIICNINAPCAPGFPGYVALIGGTSLSSPMFAGIQALIDQGMAKAGLSANQGNAAPTLYQLAAKEYGTAGSKAPATLAACNADNGITGTGACVFHNITRGGNSTQCVQFADFAETTPDCYFYATIQDFGGLGSAKIGLTATSTSKYNDQTAAYLARPGWSFANGLGSVDAANLFAAWKVFAGAP